MSRYLRYLRIAFSALCLIACGLLIALWVRSYWRTDSICGHVSATSVVCGKSNWGSLILGTCDQESWEQNWTLRTWPSGKIDFQGWKQQPEILWGFGIYQDATDSWVMFPDLFLVIVMASMAATPWLKQFHQFSLLTLLIATTLVAVLLGLIVWSIR